MCGIGGVFSRATSPGLLDQVGKRLSAALEHRGPDGAGVWIDEAAGVVLVHRRLAIIDLSSAGHQPMASDDGRVVLTYNGEIYNFRELRAELEAKGHRFRSQSDTEVLLRLYLEEGEDLLPKLNGIFAFAIWDSRAQKLFLARDGMGVKPLYYYQGPRAFAFASELAFLVSR